MALRVRDGSLPSSEETSLSMRPSTPPASLTRLNAVSLPSFILRPSSFVGPVKAAAMPNLISRSVMPRTGGPATAVTGAVGAVAATADDGDMMEDAGGAGEADLGAIDRSRSAS